MDTPRNDPDVQNNRLPWPTWMSGPDRVAAAAAAADADTVVLNRAALHDTLTHHRPVTRPLPSLDTAEDETTTAAHPALSTAPTTTTAPTAPQIATRPPDIGPWLTLMILGLGIVTVMLVLTVTWT